jgi:murein DD-endopeptidase MepM/ murein hydrolase activator NlpD
MSNKFLWLLPLALVVALIGIGRLVSARSLVTPAQADEKVVISVVDSVNSTTTFTWPTEVKYISHGFDSHHSGVDITLEDRGKESEGKKVFAAQSGVIKYAKLNDGGYGNLIIITHADGFETYYGHLSEMEVKEGDYVVQGQEIGKIGETGRSTGPHLHFEIRKDKKILDPLLYLSQDKVELALDNSPTEQAASTDFIWPTTAWMLVRGVQLGHTGIDISTNNGSSFGRPVFVAQSGTTTFAGWSKDDGSGNLVIIDHGDGYVTRYAHLSQIFVTVGQRVEQGQNLGAIGSTGRSTGPHLHFEIRMNGEVLNPLDYVKPPQSIDQKNELLERDKFVQKKLILNEK